MGTVHVARDVSAEKRREEEREALIARLQEALAQAKILGGLLPIFGRRRAGFFLGRGDRFLGGHVRHVALGLQDRDHTAASRELAASFVNSTYFDIVLELPSGADLEDALERRRARAILVIPEGFGSDLAAGRTRRC